jgi:hypothetical protein
VRVQPDGQQLDLALQLSHAPQQVLALLPKRLGQRDDGLDEPALAIVGGWDVVHAERLRRHGRATMSKSDAAEPSRSRRALGARDRTGRDSLTSARVIVASVGAPAWHAGLRLAC